MRKSEEKRPSESFVMGVVALVFLVIGYQVSLFVHRAAVLRIEANRDRPDTVYVYREIFSENSAPAAVAHTQNVSEEKDFIKYKILKVGPELKIKLQKLSLKRKA